MNSTAFFVAGAFYITAWMLRDYMWSKERERLLDRIMAKSLPEFKHEIRKEEILKVKRDPKPSPSDAELAEWENKHQSQVADNNAAVESALADLKRKAVEKVGGVHGS